PVRAVLNDDVDIVRLQRPTRVRPEDIHLLNQAQRPTTVPEPRDHVRQQPRRPLTPHPATPSAYAARNSCATTKTEPGTARGLPSCHVRPITSAAALPRCSSYSSTAAAKSAGTSRRSTTPATATCGKEPPNVCSLVHPRNRPALRIAERIRATPPSSSASSTPSRSSYDPPYPPAPGGHEIGSA